MAEKIIKTAFPSKFVIRGTMRYIAVPSSVEDRMGLTNGQHLDVTITLPETIVTEEEPKTPVEEKPVRTEYLPICPKCKEIASPLWSHFLDKNHKLTYVGNTDYPPCEYVSYTCHNCKYHFEKALADLNSLYGTDVGGREFFKMEDLVERYLRDLNGGAKL